jgi:hypothetical protein
VYEKAGGGGHQKVHDVPEKRKMRVRRDDGRMGGKASDGEERG